MSTGRRSRREELQQRITEKWDCLDQHVIDDTVKQWRKHLCACVAANGGYFEHLLLISYNFCCFAVNAEFYCHKLMFCIKIDLVLCLFT